MSRGDVKISQHQGGYQCISPHRTNNEELTLDEALERIPFGKFHLMS